MTWTLADIPDQTGRTVVVTGPSRGGLGYYASLELARRGARVVLAGRSEPKLQAAADAIRAEVAEARLERLVVDLASLASVRSGAAAAARFGAIDVLLNNAGIMAPPYRRTADGFESQLGTNHFGPFLLTGLLLPQLAASGAGRVVTVSSQMHRLATKPPLGDPTTKPRPYFRWTEYGKSKLANLLFTYELQRRCEAAGLPIEALAAHPGYAGTHLVSNGQLGKVAAPLTSIVDAANRAISQSADAGAWPLLMAATADLPGGTYVGPSGKGQLSGAPRVVGSTPLARSRSAQERLWALSEEAVGLSYP